MPCSICKEVGRQRREGRTPDARELELQKMSVYGLKKFGLSWSEYCKLLAKQKGGCAICKSKIPGSRKGKTFKRFVVDHDHQTGTVRGLLCSKCNTSIGMLNDDINLLQAACRYLKKHNVLS